MTHDDLSFRAPGATAIEHVIATHGAAKVLFAAIRALLRPRALTAPRPRPPDASDLPAHLRQDLGLPPAPRVLRWETHALSHRL